MPRRNLVAARCRDYEYSHPLLIVAFITFIANFLFGLLVATRVVDSSRFRVVHHALFFVVMITAILATVMAFIDGASHRWMMAAMTAMLLVMIALPGRGVAHKVYATVCLAAYSTIAFVI